MPKQHGQGATNIERSGPQTAWFRTWRYQPDSTAHSPANQLFWGLLDVCGAKQEPASTHIEVVKSDADLLREARNDPEALGELYRRHAPAIARWFAARTPERIASELTAETFAQAALSLRRFQDRADGSAAPWLYGIAHNLLRRSLERERVESAARVRLGMPLRAYDSELDEVDSRLDAARIRPALEEALEQLPSSQREAIQLRVIRALDYEEVASSLGCSKLAARLRVARGLGSLSRLLKGVTS